MSRWTLHGAWVCLILGSSGLARAEDSEDKALALVAKFGFAVRDDARPNKPVVGVVLIGTVIDADLKEFVAFKNLTHLDLGGCPQVTDVGLQELAALKNLMFLSLSGEKVTDAGVKNLVNLKNLTKLELTGTSVTEAGVKEIQKALPGCKVTK